MSLPSYSGDVATCAKCGSSSVTTRYVESHQSWTTPECGATLNDFKYREHMDRFCQRCHFVWGEACIDAAPAAPGQEGEQR